MRFSSPLLQQWQQAVDSHPGILVLIRVGDFYETYAEQAEDGAKILKITLTSRSDGEAGRTPMCGVPFHSVERYLARLIQAGRKVALCDQPEVPISADPPEKGEAIRVFTKDSELPFDDGI